MIDRYACSAMLYSHTDFFISQGTALSIGEMHENHHFSWINHTAAHIWSSQQVVQKQNKDHLADGKN